MTHSRPMGGGERGRRYSRMSHGMHRAHRGMSPYPDTPDVHADIQHGETDTTLTSLIAQLARVAQRLEEEQDWRERMSNAIFRVRIPGLLVPLSAGAGELTDEIWMAPPPDSMMSVRRLTISGFTAGSVTAWVNREDPAVPYPVPATNTFGKGDVLLESGEHLTVIASGITGFVQVNGEIDVFPAWYLKYYLGSK